MSALFESHCISIVTIESRSVLGLGCRQLHTTCLLMVPQHDMIQNQAMGSNEEYRGLQARPEAKQRVCVEKFER